MGEQQVYSFSQIVAGEIRLRIFPPVRPSVTRANKDRAHTGIFRGLNIRGGVANEP